METKQYRRRLSGDAASVPNFLLRFQLLKVTDVLQLPADERGDGKKRSGPASPGPNLRFSG
jgi:hypothetical protein